MRILIDTNILISGLFFGGIPKKLLFELDENFNICVNDEIISEYNEQIDKKVSKPKYKLDVELKEKFFNNLHNFEIKSDLKICRDPDDDKFINCAIDAKAIYIVSGDNDLLTIKNFAGIEIVTAREFYDKYLK
ncbi:MAG: putative toxin-antitoxin system toxin component, PIN family [Selenomonadaceae bacterium]|nr:putative toxin-antitoxin system toxin component, PIN family [Selenomonadaceae bacterium]MBR6012581.1 putative toxin-antitoxin system toxin component, PIN family [Selenomonadaceae bacterium]